MWTFSGFLKLFLQGLWIKRQGGEDNESNKYSLEFSLYTSSEEHKFHKVIDYIHF